MSLFEIPSRNGKDKDKEIASKSKVQKKTPTTVRGGGLLSNINLIKENVERYLGNYRDKYEVITTQERLTQYIMNCVANGVISIDTETTGLDPMEDKIVGLCIYTPNEKPAYVPINHVSYITNERVKNQLDEETVKHCLSFLGDTKVIMFNANFDIRVLRNQVGIKLDCYWDCYLASRCMNENEPRNKLKPLHQKYVLEDAEDEFAYDELFKGISFALIPIDIGYLYAAHDAIVTYELYEFQKQYLYYDPTCAMEDRNGMNGVSWLFHNVEMPCVSVVVDMEDTGVDIDLDYAKELSVKYHKMLDERITKFYEEIEVFREDIDRYTEKFPDTKLSDPININSVQQLAILFYDILGVEEVDKKSKRGTGKDIIPKIMDKYSDLKGLCTALLEYRKVEKLINTYIDKIPNILGRDNRVHGKFNQYGADTGRFSSDNPNLQNIPSRNKDIRPMFKATDGYVMMSADYSQQEPKVMARMCNDEKMLSAARNGRDLYAEIAAMSFNTTYDNCLEFNQDGSTNKEGKERRSQAKSILLGVLYGRGVPSIAEQLGTSVEKAQAIKDSVFKGFPAIEKFESDSLDMCRDFGYVTTLWGRKRRLPDLQLPTYEFRYTNSNSDVLDFDNDEQEVPDNVIDYYLAKLRNCKPWDKRKIFEEANKEGIWIVDNGMKIADAERQCVNARIQGSAADMTKLAMIKVGNDEELKRLGFRLLIQVHDELIGECPEENMQACKERFAYLMSSAAEDRLSMPIKCDVEVTRSWYGKEKLA